MDTSFAFCNNHDTVGQIYEYFLQNFALASGRRSGEFYTPSCVVKLLVNLLKPKGGRIYDPCCGTGGMFIQSSKFAENFSIFGQEKEPEVWRWCQLNSFIHGLEYDLGEREENTFLHDLHSDIKVDYVLCNPPFNLQEWSEGEKVDEERWTYGTPPDGNANYAWIQHIINKLNEKGVAGIILANGSVSAEKQEKIIRQNILEANLVEGIIQLPNKLFYTTQISAVIWIIKKNRKSRKLFFFNAKDFEGEMLDRRWRELTPSEINLIANEYENWLKDDK